MRIKLCFLLGLMVAVTAASAQQGPQNDASPEAVSKARTITAELAGLIESGRDMEELRNSDEPGALRTCGVQMRERQDRIASLQEQTKALSSELRPWSTLARAAATSATMCVSCLESALENCEIADWSLGEAQRALP